MAAWGSQHKAWGKVRMLADPNGSFVSSMGLEVIAAGLGGLRSKRWAAVVENGVITELTVEPDGFGLSCSLSKSFISKL